MPTSPLPLEVLSVAAPCLVAWESMSGDDRARFCGQCQQQVFNLADLSRAEAETLVQQATGRLCVRFYRRHDGTILTNDCPLGARSARRFRMIAGLACAALGMLLGGVLTVLGAARHDERGRRLRDIEPFHTIVEWFSPSPPQVIMGKVCMPEDMLPAHPPDVPDAASPAAPPP